MFRCSDRPIVAAPQRRLRFRTLTAFAVALACFPSAFAELLTGRVVGVADGDTITILVVEGATKTPRKIRINGIDAPEKAQAFGNRSKEAMSDLAFGKEAEADCGKVDRYGRDICLVRVAGVDVGLKLIEQGLAWHYKAYQRDQKPADRVRYDMAETESREAKRGLWRALGTNAPPVPPWEWRKAKRSGS